MEHIVRLQHAGDLNNGETIKIKVSGDGTNIGKRLTIAKFTYTICNEKEGSMGEKAIMFWLLSKLQKHMKPLGQSCRPETGDGSFKGDKHTVFSPGISGQAGHLTLLIENRWHLA